jgi:hypothetical protein
MRLDSSAPATIFRLGRIHAFAGPWARHDINRRRWHVTIKDIWLYPPLAFARVGGSSEACDAFLWGDKDLSASGTGRTTLKTDGIDNLNVDAAGVVSVHAVGAGQGLRIKDEQGFRPVCPFFELHGTWDEENADGQTVSVSGPITEDLLKRWGLQVADLSWTVRVANRKAWRYTRSEGDIVECTLALDATDNTKVELKGRSRVVAASGGVAALVPDGAHISMGWVQLTQSTPAWAWPQFEVHCTQRPGVCAHQFCRKAQEPGSA